MRELRRAVLWVVAVVAIATPGCGSGSDTNAGTTSGRTSSSGSSSSGGEGGGGGAGGAGGGTMVDPGHSATETVTAGDVAKSPSYTMVFTFGQPTQNQEKTTSPSYGLRGGLIGATGSKP